MDKPIRSFAEVLVSYHHWKFEALGHDKRNVGVQGNRFQVIRLVQRLTLEDITTEPDNSHPDHFRLDIRQSWTTIMSENLQIVRIVRMKTFLELFVVAPLAPQSSGIGLRSVGLCDS